MNVRIGELPRYHVAYMRHVGPYGAHGIPALWKRLHEWTRTRGLDTPDSIKLGIGHDDPDKQSYSGQQPTNARTAGVRAPARERVNAICKANRLLRGAGGDRRSDAGCERDAIERVAGRAGAAAS